MKGILKLNHPVKVTYYPYRTADVTNIFIEVDRTTEEARQFENALAAEVDMECPDNHSCFKLENFWDESAPPLYIKCSDFKVSIGTGIIERVW